jgi:hypothetical protein
MSALGSSVTTLFRKMATLRLALAAVVFIYSIGVGIILSPTLRSKWSVAPASDFPASMSQELPYALAWPVRLVRVLETSGGGVNAPLRGSIPPEDWRLIP